VPNYLTTNTTSKQDAFASAMQHSATTTRWPACADHRACADRPHRNERVRLLVQARSSQKNTHRCLLRTVLNPTKG